MLRYKYTTNQEQAKHIKEETMKQITRLMVAGLITAGLQLTACQKPHATHHAEHRPKSKLKAQI
jgi:hypothetical protein